MLVPEKLARLEAAEPLGQYHEVERVLDTRRRKGRTEYLVRWLHYPAKFDSWVSEITPYKTESDLNPNSK